MKLGGKVIERYTGRVSIARIGDDGKLEQLSILVRQLPLTWQEECEKQLPQPKPPIVGKIFDKAGRESPKFNDEDPAYVESLQRWEHRTWAKKIHDATIDPGVTWETPDSQDRGEFYDGIWSELLASFSRSEVASWVMTINAIDQVGGADILLAQEGLSRVIQGAREVQELADKQDGEK